MPCMRREKSFLPYKVQEESACQDSQEVEHDAHRVAKPVRDDRYDSLGHFIVRADIKHIDICDPADGQIQNFGQEAENTKKKSGHAKPSPCVVCDSRQTTDKSDADEGDMPEIGMNGQGRDRIVHACRVQKDEDSAQERKIHQKRIEDSLDMTSAEKWKEDQKVHGDRAELERKIPPVVRTAIYTESNHILFPQFAESHEDPDGSQDGFDM